MFARIWPGRTLASNADEYVEFLLERAVSDYQSVDGCSDYQSVDGCYNSFILRRKEDDITHFLTLSIWESKEAIKTFAGDEIDKAKYYDDDENYLLEFESTVDHYEIYPKEFPL